ncbi:hypothetical protein MMU07_17425 [Aquiflexum sp. LQ15W]|uniref:hypothetical protein n=1 Tax=Cognataquiflexum nitidum TaxID=2922272 RepID=UPI001F141E48|nr:hypothetical protein [Cognataquiflexum nitidum]MCH6201368.1 hypothetical protein [Cognataquiflexum nitidum]
MKKLNFAYSLLLLLLASFFATQCSLKNTEDQLPFSFVENDFQSIELPELLDEELELEPALQPIVISSPSAARMIQNLDAASDPSELSEETKSNILLTKYIGEITTPDLRQHMLTEIEGLNEGNLSLVFFGRPSLDASISDVVKSVMANNRFKDLFPTLILPEILPITESVSPVELITISYRVSPAKGNCGKAAQDALDRAIRRLQEKRDGQLNEIESSLQVRIQEANQRLTARNLVAEQIYNLNLKISAEQVAKMLNAARRMRLRNPILAEELRLLALAKAVADQIFFQQVYQAALNVNKLIRDNEIMVATLRKQKLEAEINQNFNNEFRNAIATLERVLEACHNQGRGN